MLGDGATGCWGGQRAGGRGHWKLGRQRTGGHWMLGGSVPGDVGRGEDRINTSQGVTPVPPASRAGKNTIKAPLFMNSNDGEGDGRTDGGRGGE